MPSAIKIYTLLLLLLIAKLPAQAQQQIRLRGTILQPDKKTPIPGAGIQILGSSTATLSDAAGQFNVQVQPQDSILIRAVGFKPVLYLVQQQPVSELRLSVILQEDSIQLQEVQIRGVSSEEMIRQALHNMEQATESQVKRPGYDPAFEPPPPLPEPLPNPVLNPASYFSREGKQRKKLQQLQDAAEAKRKQEEEARLKAEQEKAKQDYNRFFKDNTGYQ